MNFTDKKIQRDKENISAENIISVTVEDSTFLSIPSSRFITIQFYDDKSQMKMLKKTMHDFDIFKEYRAYLTPQELLWVKRGTASAIKYFSQDKKYRLTAAEQQDLLKCSLSPDELIHVRTLSSGGFVVKNFDLGDYERYGLEEIFESYAYLQHWSHRSDAELQDRYKLFSNDNEFVSQVANSFSNDSNESDDEYEAYSHCAVS